LRKAFTLESIYTKKIRAKNKLYSRNNHQIIFLYSE